MQSVVVVVVIIVVVVCCCLHRCRCRHCLCCCPCSLSLSLSLSSSLLFQLLSAKTFKNNFSLFQHLLACKEPASCSRKSCKSEINLKYNIRLDAMKNVLVNHQKQLFVGLYVANKLSSSELFWVKLIKLFFFFFFFSLLPYLALITMFAHRWRG